MLFLITVILFTFSAAQACDIQKLKWTKSAYEECRAKYVESGRERDPWAVCPCSKPYISALSACKNIPELVATSNDIEAMITNHNTLCSPLEEYKQQLIAFYEEFDPKKANKKHVERLLKRFPGRENELLKKLHLKYNPDASEL